MKQKIIPLICICMIVVLSVPSVPAFADSVSFKIGTLDTLDSIVEDASTYTGNYIYRCETSWFNSWTSEDYSSYLDLSSMPFDCFNNASVWITGKGSSTGDMTIWCVDLTDCPNPTDTIYTGSAGSQIGIYYSSDPAVSTVPYYIYIYNSITNTWRSYTSGNLTKQYTRLMTTYYDENVGSNVVDTNVDEYIYNFTWSSNGTFLWGNVNSVFDYNYWFHYDSQDYSNTAMSVIPGNFPLFMYSHQLSGTRGTVNFFNGGNVLYWNGEQYVEPEIGSGEETNANHMYFTKCDFGFCEPSNVNSFSNFGGAYFYIDYDVDQWVRDHISDYQIEFHVDCYVGSDHYSFTTHEVLDPDMCLTVPFSYFDGFSYGFSSFVTNQRIDSSFLKSYLYCVLPNSYIDFYNKISSGSFGGSLSNALNNLIYSSSGSSGVLVYTTPSASTVITSSILNQEFLTHLFYNNNFEITCSAKLLDNNQNESGSVTRKFDLVRGSSTAEDNSGLTNEDPYVSNDEDGEGYLPTLPDYTGGGSVSGNGAVTVNNNMPGKLDVNIDNGFNQFMHTYNTSSEVQTAQNGFWGSFGLFKDNPATTLYSQYFGFLPDGFKEIVLGGACIGIIGGAFAALRKKLT